MRAEDSAATAFSVRPSRALRLLGLAVVAWALLPPFTPPALQTTLVAEIVDHVIPAGILAFVLAWGWGGASRYALFNLGLVMSLAALFMVGAHLPLVAQAIRGEAPWAGTIHHTLSPLAVLAYGATWTWSFR